MLYIILLWQFLVYTQKTYTDEVHVQNRIEDILTEEMLTKLY